MSVEDVERTVNIVTTFALALSVFTVWLADVNRTRAPLVRGGLALLLSTFLFIYHSSVALSAERRLF